MCNHDSKEVEIELYKVMYKLKDNKQLIIRVPVESDAGELINYMKIVDSETKFLAREVGEFSFTLEQEVSFIKSLSDNKNSQMLIGEIDGQIIANCAVGLVMNKKRYRHRASLGIAIRKDYWNRGIGTIMMQECINWCRRNGVEQLELEVVTVNEGAVKLYKKLGFQVYGTKKHALKYSDGSYADEYFMILDI